MAFEIFETNANSASNQMKEFTTKAAGALGRKRRKY